MMKTISRCMMMLGVCVTVGCASQQKTAQALAEENLVKCFAGKRGTKASYQIIGGESCHFHIHLKCTSCGRLLHMSDADSHLIAENVLKSGGFALDLGGTTLFGLCEGCRMKGNHA